MRELYELFCRCLPFAVREEAHARALLAAEENTVLTERDGNGKLIGAAVAHKNNILLLCVEEACRGQGIGSRLLERRKPTSVLPDSIQSPWVREKITWCPVCPAVLRR